MKFELEVVRFDVTDVVTASGGTVCANPAISAPLGDKLCDGDLGM